MGKYEDELRAIVTAEQWKIPALNAMRGSLETLVRTVPTALQPDGWTGDAADAAKVAASTIVKQFGQITQILDEVETAINQANAASDRAAAKIGDLPDAKVDSFWVNAARTASQVVYFGQTLPADTAVSFIEAHMATQREEAAKAAVQDLKLDLDTHSDAIRGSRVQLQQLEGMPDPVPERTDQGEDPWGNDDGSSGGPAPIGGGRTGGGGTGGGGSGSGLVHVGSSGSGSTWSTPDGGPDSTWNPPTSNDPGFGSGNEFGNGNGNGNSTSVDGGVGTGTFPGGSNGGFGNGDGSGGGGSHGGSGGGLNGGLNGGGLGSGLAGGGAGAAALAAAKLGGAGGAGRLGLGAAGGGAGGAGGRLGAGGLGAGGLGGAGGAGLGGAAGSGGPGGAGSGARLGTGGLLGSTPGGGAAAAGGAGGGAAAAGGSGARGGTGMMGGGGGAGGGDKEKRSGLGGLMAPKLEDEDDAAPRSTGASAGGRQPKSED